VVIFTVVILAAGIGIVVGILPLRVEDKAGITPKAPRWRRRLRVIRLRFWQVAEGAHAAAAAQLLQRYVLLLFFRVFECRLEGAEVG
jgi:hypothetical protein